MKVLVKQHSWARRRSNGQFSMLPTLISHLASELGVGTTLVGVGWFGEVDIEGVVVPAHWTQAHAIGRSPSLVNMPVVTDCRLRGRGEECA